MSGLRHSAVFLILWLVFLTVVSPAQSGERFMTDMPDEFEGPQIHLIYAVPSDGLDNGHDLNGTLRNTVALAQQWVFREVGRTLKFDTYQGQPDISFARLSRTEDTLFDVGDSNGSIAFELELMGFDDPQKLYAVFYEGAFQSGPCGGNGGVGGIALQILGGRTHCPFFGFGASANGSGQLRQGTFDAAMVHEVFHALGLVAACAPDHDDAHPGHLETISDDLMAFDGSGFTFYRLDKNRSEYYNHNISGCLDLAGSALWANAAADADPIPGKPVGGYIDLPTLPCAREGAIRSEGGGEASPIRFINLSKRDVQFYWIGFDGARNPSARLGFFEAANGGSAGNHVFLATYEDTGDCIGIYALKNGSNRIMIVDDTTPPNVLAILNGESTGSDQDASNEGLPDQDGDGVPDEDDLCPTFPGDPAKDGC